MGVRNWLNNRSNWKGWGALVHSDSSEKDENVSASEQAHDDATRVFLQELQEIASQLKESNENKINRD